MNVISNLSIKNRLPSLYENTFLRYFNFVALYFAQGVPEGMLLYGIPAWMVMNGKTPGEIASFVIACGLPWSFKFIVAPMMDRFTFLKMGRKRPWVIFGQLGLMTTFIIMSFVDDPLNNLHTLMLAGFTVSFFGAFQDVATDGMAVDIIPVEEQAKANGLMWGAKIIGTSFSLAVGSWLLHLYDFSTSILMLSVLVCLIMMVPICIRERPGEKLLPWTKGEASSESEKMQLTNFKDIFKSLYKAFTLRNSLLFALIIFITEAAFNYIDTLLPIFTVQHLGWTDQIYSNFYATSSLIGGISGMLIGGYLIDRFGKIQMLNIYLFLLFALSSGFVFLNSHWHNRLLIIGFLIIYQMLYVFCMIGIFAIAMQCCWKKVSASQFTLFMTISNIGRLVGAALIVPIKASFSWEYTVLSFSILIIIMWIALQFLNINKQVARIQELDNLDYDYQVLLLSVNKN